MHTIKQIQITHIPIVTRCCYRLNKLKTHLKAFSKTEMEQSDFNKNSNSAIYTKVHIVCKSIKVVESGCKCILIRKYVVGKLSEFQ